MISCSTASSRKSSPATPDLAVALARYDEARADAAQARADLFPQVGVGADATANRQSENRPLRIGGPNYYDDNVLSASVSYELDLWGRVRNEVAAGKAQAQASAADAASVRLSLEAQLADAYLNLRMGPTPRPNCSPKPRMPIRARLKLTEGPPHTGGAVAGFSTSAAAETQLKTAQAQQIDIAAQRALFEHEIASLVGEPASTFSLAPLAQLPDPPRVPVAAPSLLLQRRPDIAAAERRAAAANAQIGVARAAFYPTISLGATGGLENAGNVDLLQAANSFWSVGPAAALTVFDGGRRKAIVREARDQFNEASATYKSTVLAAFQQVEDNLALCNKLADEAQVQTAAVVAAQHTENLALTQYRLGEVTYLDVVTAQTTDYQAEQTALTIATRRLQASVDLVRALGGGWSGAMNGVRCPAWLSLRPAKVRSGRRRGLRRPVTGQTMRDEMRVSDAKLAEVRERGFTVVPGFLDAETLAEARAALWDIHPRPEDYFADPSKYPEYEASQFFRHPDLSLRRLGAEPAAGLSGSDRRDRAAVRDRRHRGVQDRTLGQVRRPPSTRNRRDHRDFGELHPCRAAPGRLPHPVHHLPPLVGRHRAGCADQAGAGRIHQGPAADPQCAAKRRIPRARSLDHRPGRDPDDLLAPASCTGLRSGALAARASPC